MGCLLFNPRKEQFVWTKEALNALVKEKLSGYLFIAVSNREPYIHSLFRQENCLGSTAQRPYSGSGPGNAGLRRNLDCPWQRQCR